MSGRFIFDLGHLKTDKCFKSSYMSPLRSYQVTPRHLKIPVLPSSDRTFSQLSEKGLPAISLSL